jgi:predicted ATP-grasp superfamily ATP-dependent carboligase
MEELRIERQPELERPVLIAAFRGWNDGAQGASLAGGYLAKIWNAQQFATIDPESFYDFQATRPMVSLVDGITRRIDWPENAFYTAAPERLGRDAMLLLGVEPNLRWRKFTDLIVGLAREHKVELVVTLGALLADVPHTRPARPPIRSSSSDSACSRPGTRARPASSAFSTTPSAPRRFRP